MAGDVLGANMYLFRHTGISQDSKFTIIPISGKHCVWIPHRNSESGSCQNIVTEAQVKNKMFAMFCVHHVDGFKKFFNLLFVSWIKVKCLTSGVISWMLNIVWCDELWVCRIWTLTWAGAVCPIVLFVRVYESFYYQSLVKVSQAFV